LSPDSVGAGHFGSPAKLQAAFNAHKNNYLVTACDDVTAFFNVVAAQSGKQITVARAAQLTSAGNQITTALQCAH